MLRVRVLPPSFDAEWTRVAGEPTFCDGWDYAAEGRGMKTCSGNPEIEIEARVAGGKLQWRALLCREHVGYLQRQLGESIELVDAGDMSGWARKEHG